MTAVIKSLFQASDISRANCREMPTCTYAPTASASVTRFCKSKPAHCWPGFFFKLWVQAGQYTLGLFSSRDTKRLLKCH